MHPLLGEYGIGDIKIVGAFDVDKNKVGPDLSKAIFAKPNNTIKFHEVPHLGVTVQRGMTHSGIGKYTSDMTEKSSGPSDHMAREKVEDFIAGRDGSTLGVKKCLKSQKPPEEA